MPKPCCGGDSVGRKSNATVSVVKFRWVPTSLISPASRLGWWSRSTEANTPGQSNRTSGALGGSSRKASGSGIRMFSKKRTEFWKASVQLSWTPHPDPPPQGGREVRSPHPDPPPQGRREGRPPTLTLPHKGGGQSRD